MQHVGVYRHKVLLASMFLQKYKNLFISHQKDFIQCFWIGEGDFCYSPTMRFIFTK